MLEDITRRSERYKTAGLKNLSFGFRVWETGDVRVERGSESSYIPEVLVEGRDYVVNLNADQTAAPGGTCVLTAPLEAGEIAVVISDVPYTQEVQLTNYSRFPPTIINTGMDRLEAQIQQLKLDGEWSIKVPSTSDRSPEQVASDLLTARDFVEEKSAEAAQSAENAEASNRAAGSNAEASRKSAEEARESAEEAAIHAATWEQATQAAERIEAINDALHNLNAEASTVEPDVPADARYISETNTLHLDIPRGETGLTGDSIIDAELDEAGHLIVTLEAGGEEGSDNFVATFEAALEG